MLTRLHAVHSEENIVFWIAVEFFRAQHIGTPKTSEAMRKKFSFSLKMGADMTTTGGFQGMHQAKPGCSLEEQMLQHSFDSLNLMDMPEPQVKLLNDAVRIYKTFIQAESAHWVALASKTVDEIRARIETGDVDINLFAKAQHSVYDAMKSELFPRFVKAVKLNPIEYSSQDRFELPDNTITILEDESIQL